VFEKKPSVICLQETKLGVVDDRVASAIWGTSPYGFSFQPSASASGGQLTMWDRNLIDVWSTSSFADVLVIRGSVIGSCEEFVIANVYAPCDTNVKHEL